MHTCETTCMHINYISGTIRHSKNLKTVSYLKNFKKILGSFKNTENLFLKNIYIFISIWLNIKSKWPLEATFLPNWGLFFGQTACICPKYARLCTKYGWFPLTPYIPPLSTALLIVVSKCYFQMPKTILICPFYIPKFIYDSIGQKLRK